MLQSSESSRRVRGELFLFDPSNGESRGLSAYKLEVSDVFHSLEPIVGSGFDVEGGGPVLVRAGYRPPATPQGGSFPRGKAVQGQGRNASLT